MFAWLVLLLLSSFALQAQTNNLLDIPKVAFYFFALWVGLRVVIKQTARSEMESGAEDLRFMCHANVPRASMNHLSGRLWLH